MKFTELQKETERSLSPLSEEKEISEEDDGESPRMVSNPFAVPQSGR